MKYSTRSGTSSGRARSGGISIGSTFRRKNRSARNRCLATSSSEVPVGRRDDAHVDADVVGATDALEALFLEEPQQLGLKPRRHLADLVEEHRSAVGHLEQTLLLQPRIGERAALVAEQLALEQLLGKRRAGDVHERLGRAIAGVVNDLGDQILAGAALAGQQDGRGRTRRDPRDERPQGLDRRRLADETLQAVGSRGIRRGTAAPRGEGASFPARVRRSP